jgi:hypothetical protein
MKSKKVRGGDMSSLSVSEGSGFKIKVLNY